jgi:putative Mg2+ transporter-C (MgtC) family protein
MSPHLELFVRIFVGTALGAVIGYERDLHGRPAGLRTHALVALASSTFMVVSTHFVYAQGYGREDLIEVDASRIAASVVSGIGFLAGGAILRTGFTVQGLTTAAALWLVAAIGLAAGGGMYVVALFATILGMAALVLLRRLEDKDDRRPLHRRVLISLSPEAAPLDTLIAAASRAGVIRASEHSYEHDLETKTRTVILELELRTALQVRQVLETLEREPGVRKVRLEPLA